jgi:hypothetical protein
MTVKIIYSFDASTKVYLPRADGEPVLADPDPEAPGEFLIPAFATDVPPPSPVAGQVPVFDMAANAWSLVDAPGPGETVPPSQLTLPERIARLQRGVQAHLDAQAQALGYDSIFTAVTYADEPAVPKFQVEGQSLRAWRSLVWARCYALLEAFGAGQLQEPTLAGLVAELPDFELLSPQAPESPEGGASEGGASDDGALQGGSSVDVV